MRARTPFLDSRVSRSDGFGISPPRTELDTKSAARLAAEAAFSVSRRLDSVPAPAVTVRRSKGLGPRSAPPPEQAAATAEPETAVSPAGLESAKGPRVFRLEQPPADAQRAGPDRPAAELPSATAEESTPAKVRKKKRVATEHRPGPVLHIFRAPEAASAPAGPPDAGAGGVVTARQLAVLADLLASVQPILDDIQSARALRF